MATAYVGEIRMVGFNFAPVGWAFCDGSTIAISENETLFNLIGTTYGGNGVTTFQLPDLRSRIPVHQGSSYILAQSAGTETVTLTTQQIPAHTHSPLANNGTTGAAVNSPAGNYWNEWSGSAFGNATPNSTLNAAAVSSTTGGNQPHDNMPPFLAINFVISLFGVFPSEG